MALDGKYGRITTEHGSIPDDEPVFLLRAQDAAAADTIAFYLGACRSIGAAPEHLVGVDLAHGAFLRWRDEGEGDHAVKIPDTEVDAA